MEWRRSAVWPSALFSLMMLMALAVVVSGVCTSYISQLSSNAPVFLGCTCAKCGSSSVQWALMKSFVGSEEDSMALRSKLHDEYNVPDVPHHPNQWRIDGVGSCETRYINASSVQDRNVIMFWVTRDPISRYLSAFRSKYRCCLGTEKNSTNREICMDDHVMRVPNILNYVHGVTNGTYQLPAPKPVNCLRFDEYVEYIRVTSAFHQPEKLDNHIRPQHTYCPQVFDELSVNASIAPVKFSGNISQLFQVMTTLRDTFPHKLTTEHVHSSTKNVAGQFLPEYEEPLKELCAIVEPEYRAMNDWSGLENCLVKARITFMESGL